ncbi:hypothetical protein PAMC26510_13495 [Caballeronia sordidicola]|uniref:Uncharacterized protein n=1 Tax=Caballeronia sordidicola TaxID=196367 RepID=A0A242MVH6_CABSO|nr:hypothetical protein PAMC26510_13495 [Caballeronia sordidicola]
MLFQTRGVADLIDAERGRVQARNARTKQRAAAGEHQPVVVHGECAAVRIHCFDSVIRGLDIAHAALDEADAGCIEERQQRRFQTKRVGFMKARANMQLGFGRNQGNFDGLAVRIRGIDQTSCAKRAPHAGEAGAYHQNSLGTISHFSLSIR